MQSTSSHSTFLRLFVVLSHLHQGLPGTVFLHSFLIPPFRTTCSASCINPYRRVYTEMRPQPLTYLRECPVQEYHIYKKNEIDQKETSQTVYCWLLRRIHEDSQGPICTVNTDIMHSGPALGRLDRLDTIGPRARGGFVQ
jgi:hypothetical protein